MTISESAGASMQPENTPTRAYPIPIITTDSGRFTISEGPTKKKDNAEKKAESIKVTRLSTFVGRCWTARLDVMKKVGQMVKKIPI